MNFSDASNTANDGATAPQRSPAAAKPGPAEAVMRDFHPVLFYALAFAIGWGAWTPLLLHTWKVATLPVPYPIALFLCQTLGAFAPLLALVAIGRIKHVPGLVEDILRKMDPRGLPLRWLVLPAVVPLAIAIVTALLHGVLFPAEGVTILRPEPVAELGWALLAVIPLTFCVAMIGSPLGEEPGWRGYVLDGLSRRGWGYAASALVAVLWWVWHVPLFLVLGVEPNGFSLLEMVGHSLLIDSFFLLSGRNLLSAMFYHQGVNIGFMFFNTQTKTIAGLVILLGIALAVRVLAQRRLPPEQNSLPNPAANHEN